MESHASPSGLVSENGRKLYMSLDVIQHFSQYIFPIKKLNFVASNQVYSIDQGYFSRLIP